MILLKDIYAFARGEPSLSFNLETSGAAAALAWLSWFITQLEGLRAGRPPPKNHTVRVGANRKSQEQQWRKRHRYTVEECLAINAADYVAGREGLPDAAIETVRSGAAAQLPRLSEMRAPVP